MSREFKTNQLDAQARAAELIDAKPAFARLR